MILLWLVPPVVVTLVAMAWVAWLGREGRGAVDRDEAVRRLGAALEGRPGRWDRWRPWSRPPVRPAYAAPPRPPDRSTGVALRRPAPAPPSAPGARATPRPTPSGPDVHGDA